MKGFGTILGVAGLACLVSFGSALANESSKGEKASGFASMVRSLLNPEPQTSKHPTYSPLINRYARQHGIPSDLAHAIVEVESNFNPKARGRAGEVGLMQIKLTTARLMGYRGSRKGLYDPETNIKYGMKYLAGAHKLSGGDTCGTVLRYNAGHGARRMNPISSRYCRKVRKIIG